MSASNKTHQWPLRIVAPLLLVLASVLVGLIFAEAAFRVYKLNKPSSFRLAQSVYAQFDEQFGTRFLPDSKKVLSLITNGRVVSCLGMVESANADGLGGRSTLAEAHNADYVIFTTGDSFSHWKRSNVTVPDVVESLLSMRMNRKIVNLNFARGGYGLLQMLTIAAEMYPLVKPDLVVIQFISDDVTRGRWWTREAVIDSRKRAQMSSLPNGFDDVRITNDEDVVDERATEEWCQQQLKATTQDSVAKAATDYYHAYLRTKGLAIQPLVLTKSYLLDALWTRLLGRPFHRDRSASVLIPYVTPEEFVADPGYHDAIGKLKGFGVPIFLVHLPLKAEISAGGPLLMPDQARIWNQLEKDLGTRVITLLAFPNRPETPQKIDLQPYDPHPNLDGIMFYGEYITRALEAHVRRHTAMQSQNTVRCETDNSERRVAEGDRALKSLIGD
jgi:hypothetical protein